MNMSKIQEYGASTTQNYVNQNQSTKTESTDKKETNTIYGGSLTLGQDDLIEQKRKNARNQAMNLIQSAWEKDNKTDKQIRDWKNLRDAKIQENLEAQDYLSDIEEKKEMLMEEYGIDKDSREQKDTELLEKFQDYQGGVCDKPFTKEEVERLKELQNTPRTEYQKKALALNAGAIELKQLSELNEREARSLGGSIADARIDELKSQDMLKANDSAEQLLDASNKEILGLLINQGKENVDDKIQENEEKAEEKDKEKEEQDKRIEDAKEKRKEQEKLLKGQAEVEKLETHMTQGEQSNSNVVQAQRSIQKILKENDMLEEDLKGIKIDFNS